MKYQNKKPRKESHLLLQQQQKKTKYQGINLTKEVQDLYSENYRTLEKEIEEDTKKWKHIHD